MALTGKPLVSDRVQAWQYGPVIPAIYHEFKAAGNGPIASPAFGMFNVSGLKFFNGPATLDNYPDNEERRDAKEIVAKVFEMYGNYGGARLSNATHQPGTPWQQVYKEGEKGLTIPNDLIREYFQGLENATER